VSGAGSVGSHHGSAPASLGTPLPHDADPGLTTAPIERLAASVTLLVLDFDGVLTDNTVDVRSDGLESVSCWRGDGLGLSALQGDGVAVHVLSTETDPVVGVRCRKLGVPYLQGVADKGAALQALIAHSGHATAEVAFVGNDVNDLDCLQLVGFPIVVADAHPAVIPYASLVTTLPGGRGAVREVCDLILGARQEGRP